MPYLNKSCGKCGESKPLDAFSRSAKYGYQFACKECQRTYKAANRERAAEQQRARRAADPEKYMTQNRMLRYGITRERYAEMLAEQAGTCAICSTSDPGGKYGTWHIDHDHACCLSERSCGACVRGLLCHRCNLALGLFSDNPDTIAAACTYLVGGK
jgi:hypothetical protein